MKMPIFYLTSVSNFSAGLLLEAIWTQSNSLVVQALSPVSSKPAAVISWRCR